MIAIFQSRYYSELNEKKDASSRKKEIQPIFSIKIVAIDIQLDGTAEAFSLSDKSKNPVHKNVKISVENVNRFPIKHVIIFDKYITPLLKCKRCNSFTVRTMIQMTQKVAKQSGSVD